MTNRTTNVKPLLDKCMNGGGWEGKKQTTYHPGIHTNVCVSRISLCMVEFSYTHSALNDSHVCVCVEGFLSDYFSYVYQIHHQLPYMIFGKKTSWGVLCKWSIDLQQVGCREGIMNGAYGCFITLAVSRPQQQKNVLLVAPLNQFIYFSFTSMNLMYVCSYLQFLQLI